MAQKSLQKFNTANRLPKRHSEKVSYFIHIFNNSLKSLHFPSPL